MKLYKLKKKLTAGAASIACPVVFESEDKMKIWEKILLVLILGSIWGIVEVFGGDLLLTLAGKRSSVILFAFAFFILMAARGILGAPGLLLLVGAVAAFYKTLSVNFYPCMVAGIMADAAAVEFLYLLSGKERLQSRKWRMIAAPATAYGAFTLFALFAVLILREPNWVERGLTGALGYIFLTGSFAAVLSLMLVQPAYVIGMRLKSRVAERSSRLSLRWSYGLAILLVIGIWVSRLFP